MQRVAENSTHIKRFDLITYLLPIVMIGWMGSSVKYLSSIFSDSSRWLFLFIMLVFLGSKPILFKFLDKKLTFILVLYCAWCLSTTVWSTIPLLSFMKSGLYMVLIPTLIFTGIEWVRRNPGDKIFNYLWLFSFITILSSLMGKKSLDPHEYYTGLTNNANMLGFMIAVSAPYCFWKTYQTFKTKIFYLYLVLSLSCFYFVFLSMSRASIMMVLMIFLGMLITLNLNKKLTMGIVVILLGLGVIVFNPSIVENSLNKAEQYVFKGQQTNVFHSRMIPWQLSYQAAQEGGWTGLGFGVAYGNYDFELGNRLSAASYGREKGNSQLAIVEEIGLVGLFFYSFLLLYIFSKLIYLCVVAPDQNHRVIAGLLTGAFLGMFILSLFEAWWLSPGSPESIYFWVLVGLVRGFELSIYHRRRYDQFKMET